MYKTIIEKYEKDGYESAKKSFMDLVNADRSDVTKDEVMFSYAMMVKLALVNKDNEMAEKLLRLDSKFDEAAEKKQLASKVAKKPVTARRSKAEKSQLDSKADEPRDKPGQDNSANVINILGIEFVKLYPYVCVSRKTISDADLKRIGVHNNIIGSWNKANAACDIMSNRYYNFRLPTEEEFLYIIKCHKEKGIQLEPLSAYEWTSTIFQSRRGHIYHVALDSEGGRKLLGDEYGYGENAFRVPVRGGGAIINVDTAFRVIMELKR